MKKRNVRIIALMLAAVIAAGSPMPVRAADFEIEEEDKRAYQASGSRSSVLILGKHLSGDIGTGGWGDGEEAGGV